MKIVAVIIARQGSKRFPNKALAKIQDKPLLYHIYNRIKKSNFLNQIIISTSTNPEDDDIEKFCDKNKINCFRGHPEDVLDRIYNTVKDIECDAIVEVGGDCPLVSYQLIDKGIKLFLKDSSFDMISNALMEPFTYPDGYDFILIKKEVLKEAFHKAKNISERHQPFQYIVKNKNYFKVLNFKSNENYNHWRWTLDYEEDFIFIKKIYECLNFNENFDYDDIKKLLIKNPSISKINQIHSRLRKNNSAWFTGSFFSEINQDLNFYLSKTREYEKNKEYVKALDYYYKISKIINELSDRAEILNKK